MSERGRKNSVQTPGDILLLNLYSKSVVKLLCYFLIGYNKRQGLSTTRTTICPDVVHNLSTSLYLIAPVLPY